MNTEFEVRILEIDVDKITKKLESLGAVKKFDYLQRRYVYDFIPKQDKKWIRLRTNGEVTTLTIKDIVSEKIDGTKELEIEVDDFEKTNLILNELGYRPKGYQENRRCQYLLDGVEIDMDSWPFIPTYLEIEGKCEKEVYETLNRLENDKEKITTKDVEGIYSDYGYDLEKMKNLVFEED